MYKPLLGHWLPYFAFTDFELPPEYAEQRGWPLGPLPCFEFRWTIWSFRGRTIDYGWFWSMEWSDDHRPLWMRKREAPPIVVSQPQGEQEHSPWG